MSSPKPRDASEKETGDRRSPGDDVSEEARQNVEPAKVLGEASSSAEGETEEKEHESEGEKQDEAKEKENAANAVSNTEQAPQHDWTAVYSPQYNAYYFYNAKTQETTWTNPLEPQASTSSTAETPVIPPSAATVPSQSNPNLALEGIDPELAYLDPSIAAGGPSNASGLYAAKFNARTGLFTAMDGRDPSHLSEYERAKRMSSVFFDVSAWEQEVAKRKAQEDLDEAEGRRRKKKPSKADLERYKAQKEARKKTKYAWLRE